jgi:hypothetical protein
MTNITRDITNDIQDHMGFIGQRLQPNLPPGRIAVAVLEAHHASPALQRAEAALNEGDDAELGRQIRRLVEGGE